jgi:hypothetical protein
MLLINSPTVDQVTVSKNGIVLYREVTNTMDGDNMVQTFHRTSLTPASDLTNAPASVVAICNAAWTAEVIAAYQAQVAARQV